MHRLLLGGSPSERREAARAHIGARRSVSLDTATLPFVRPEVFATAPAPGIRGAVLLLADIDRAFPDHQSGGTRLILTQSTYIVQKWIDAIGPDGAVVATAAEDALRRAAPEAFEGRGPWSQFEVVDVGAGPITTTEGTEDTEVRTDRSQDWSSVSSMVGILAAAYALDHAERRLALCREAVSLAPDSPVAHLALASAYRETGDPEGARAELDRTVALAPDWEAAHYEDGKFWLGDDDMARARDAFRRASDLMATFSAAFSNLGATLGELDDPEGALAAFHQALAHDPRGFPVINNIGVVSRELGRLDESEEAFRRVIELAPRFVFGHYNLGHTLFLAGRYPDALAAYEEGQRRDPQQNRRQGCRLAMMRFANGDAAGAARDLWRFANLAPPGERADLLLEVYEIASALVATRPDLAVHRDLLDRIGAEIGQ